MTGNVASELMGKTDDSPIPTAIAAAAAVGQRRRTSTGRVSRTIAAENGSLRLAAAAHTKSNGARAASHQSTGRSCVRITGLSLTPPAQRERGAKDQQHEPGRAEDRDIEPLHRPE